MTRPRLLLAAACLFVAAALQAQPTEQWRSWNKPIAPFRIADGLYYVGSNEMAVFLFTTPQGHILVNSGFAETVPLIRASMKTLGFRFEDVRILLTGQGHMDHVGGHALVREQTHAQVAVMEPDVRVVETGGQGDFLFEGQLKWRGCPVDRVLHDGDTVSLGGTTLKALWTPGHTKGATAFTATVTDHGQPREVVIVGGWSLLEGALAASAKYPTIVEDYARTFRVLGALKPDIFLAAHASQFGMDEKLARLREGGDNPFVDPAGYAAAVAEARASFEAELAKTRQTVR
jgi:metallo-beta-lactamase class B